MVVFYRKKKFSFQSHGHPTPNQTEDIAAFKILYKTILLKTYDLLSLQMSHNNQEKTRSKNHRSIFTLLLQTWYHYLQSSERHLNSWKVTKIHPFHERGNRHKDSHCLQLKLKHLSLYCTSSMVFICNTNLLFHTSLLFLTVAKINGWLFLKKSYWNE